MDRIKEHEIFRGSYSQLDDCQHRLIELLGEVDKILSIYSEAKLTAETENLLNIVKNEINIQKNNLIERNTFLCGIISNLMEHLIEVKKCAYCGDLYQGHWLQDDPIEGNKKPICDSCLDEHFFKCAKCKKLLPISIEDEEEGDGGAYRLCKDCTKPMGFPPEIIVCPEHCENMAFSDSSTMSNYFIDNCEGIVALEDSDGICLHFVKQLSTHYALYESQSGQKYEIGELDWHGRGSMEELEEE